MKKGLFFILITSVFTGFYACKKEKLLTDNSAKLDLSAQSILFDTVFTTVGSTTKSFKIYNKHDQPIKVSSIRLGGGSNSNFRINVDGSPGIQLNDIDIAPNDSAFVFVEVTVNPNSSLTPFVIRDSVIFTTNGNDQKVILEAWGQNAHFHANTYLTCNEIWTNDKPHVVYGYVIIPAGCSLTIQQGVRVYMHAGAILVADSAATLIVNGAQHNEVTFQGDRLEAEFADAPGQWGYIWLYKESLNSTIDWAIIKNGYIGLRCDSFPSSGYELTIKNSIIKNMAMTAIWGADSKINGYNSVFANCGQYVAALAYGGEYNFYHCTFGNYWTYGTSRQFPTLLLNNYYSDVNSNLQTRALDSANFYNCIIYGSVDDEIKLDGSTNTTPPFNYDFHNCVLKTTYGTTSGHFQNCVVNLEASFRNVSTNDYRLSPLSSAINKGDPSIPNRIGLSFLNLDLLGSPRIVDGAPDCGAYEYYP